MIKKVKGKVKESAKKPRPAKSSTSKTKQAVDLAKVRNSINDLVGKAAENIAIKVIEVATTTGQLASAKYLFEAVGLYPATEATEAQPEEKSLAFTLLRRMGLPTEPVNSEELEPGILSVAKEPTLVTAKVADRDLLSEEDQEAEPADSEE
jgi:hypothetical protein